MTEAIIWVGCSARMDGDLYAASKLSENVWVAYVNGSQLGEWKTTEQGAKNLCEREYRRRLASRDVVQEFAVPTDQDYIEFLDHSSPVKEPWPAPVVWQLQHHTAEQAAALVEPAPVALTNIEDLFNALCVYQRDARQAGINVKAHAVAREAFKEAIGPLALFIDWTDKS